jgi:hypothetical protein
VKTDVYKNFHNNLHSVIPDIIAERATNSRTDEQLLIELYNGIICSNTNNRTIATHTNQDEAQMLGSLKDTLPLLFPVTLHHVNPRNNLGKKIF